ncbi:MAG: alpha/beta hydrolase [Deltaproteobacteria bacterium]|nr:alpha/beta hydrolase [Deltaproteobacteria bacterium]
MLELLPGQVTIENDVVFGTTGSRDLKGDIFRPPVEGNQYPGILIIHGGGWYQGDRSQLRYYGIQLARYGFVGVACEYRLSGEAPWPAQIHDVKAALRWMRANADQLGIDEGKICVTGNSAGAHLALMLGADTDVFEGASGSPNMSSKCAAICAIYPPTKLVFNKNEIENKLFGKAGSDDVAAKASPINYAASSFPPTILIHGNADEIVPVSESFNMYHALKQAGAPVELHIFDEAPHAFDSLAEFARPCVQLITLFFDRKVVNPRAVEVPEETEQ